MIIFVKVVLDRLKEQKMKVDIFLNKTVEENAAFYYEQVKKAKKKIKGATEAIEKFKTQLADINESYQEKAQRKSQRKHFWFEKFRWFFTSAQFLVIGGRDATTNEIIVKKHTEKGDIVFHTDMAGSPFFVIKAGGKSISQQSLQEVADATASFSRAWKLGMSTNPVFYVNPEQVSKQANSGEYLTKGAFVIKGKTNYLDNKMNLAIGVIKDGEYKSLVMCAPLESIKANCDIFFALRPGDNKPSDIAKKLKKDLNAPIDEIIRVMPSGNMEIVKERK